MSWFITLKSQLLSFVRTQYIQYSMCIFDKEQGCGIDAKLYIRSRQVNSYGGPSSGVLILIKRKSHSVERVCVCVLVSRVLKHMSWNIRTVKAFHSGKRSEENMSRDQHTIKTCKWKVNDMKGERWACLFIHHWGCMWHHCAWMISDVLSGYDHVILMLS